MCGIRALAQRLMEKACFHSCQNHLSRTALYKNLYTLGEGLFSPTPIMLNLTRCSTRSLPYALTFFSLWRKATNLYFARYPAVLSLVKRASNTHKKCVPISTSHLLVPELSPKHAINYWRSDSVRPGVWRVALLIEMSD